MNTRSDGLVVPVINLAIAHHDQWLYGIKPSLKLSARKEHAYAAFEFRKACSSGHGGHDHLAGHRPNAGLCPSIEIIELRLINDDSITCKVMSAILTLANV